jgi:hypothetical protein
MRSSTRPKKCIGSACAFALALGCEASTPDPQQQQLHLLQANVGNVDSDCAANYLYNLCLVDIEGRIADAIAQKQPDVVALQELVSDAQCDGFEETDRAKVCHPAHRAAEPSQVRRLVGPDYTIACDARNGYECVAVAQSFGTIPGCEPGTSCPTLARTPAASDGCDDGFTVSAVEVRPHHRDPFTLVNAHPPSGAAAGCRDEQLLQIFEGTPDVPPLAEDGPTLLSGDFNLDPFNDNPLVPDDPSVETWDAWVGPGKRFAYHSGPAERMPPHYTGFFYFGIRFVLDHVASDFLEGTCTTLGEAPGTSRLDGLDDAEPHEGTDHRALDCHLRWPDAPGD